MPIKPINIEAKVAKSRVMLSQSQGPFVVIL